jgi:hypothetical protein
VSLPAALLDEPVDSPANASWVAAKLQKRYCGQRGSHGRPFVSARYRRPTPICELPGLQPLTQAMADYQRRQAQGFRLKSTPAAVYQLLQPFLKPLTTNAHGSFLTGLPNPVKSSF